MNPQVRCALVVEDHPAQRRLAVLLLRQFGVTEIHEAEDGVSGLALAQAHHPQLLICDVDMPNSDGMDLLRKVSDLRPSPQVLIVSSIEPALLQTVATLARQNGLSVLGAIPKPLDVLTLKKALVSAAVAAESEVVKHQAPAALPDERLLEALDRGWYEPFFEPKIDREAGQVVGAEVLARLVIPGQAVVPPIFFIERLEKLGKIDEMTWQIAEKSMAHAGRWTQEGWPLKLAINLSPLMLNDDIAVERLTVMTRAAGLNTNQVTFEITESAAIDATGPMLERLTRLRVRGFGLSIDDFGTGYSSLSQLSNVPFTELKIDRVFSFGSVTDYKSRAVAESSIQLAGKMNMQSCAEGVENTEVFQLMHDLGSKTFQGYLFHKPQPAESFRIWAKAWNESVTLRQLYMGKEA